MKSIISAVCTVLLALGGISGAAAQNQMGQNQGGQSSSGGGLTNPKNIVQNFSVQTVGPVLNELGVNWQVNQLESGAQYIVAASGAFPFVMQFTACSGAGQSGCLGMITLSFFSGDTPNAQTVQAFNANSPFATAGVSQEGTAYLSRYDIADFGIPRGNIASSIVNFVSLSGMFADELSTSSQTVSLDGYVSDMADNHLNRVGAENLTGLRAAPKTPLERHQAGFEGSAELIRQLLKEEAVPHNKIVNKHN